MQNLKTRQSVKPILKEARDKKNWTLESKEPLHRASKLLDPKWKEEDYFYPGVSHESWKFFLYGMRSIKADIFKAYCQVLELELEWEDIAEPSEIKETELPVVFTTKATPSIPNLNFVGREEAITYPHPNSEMPSLPELTALHYHCEKLVEKYENKWGDNFYILEKGIIQEQIPVYASLYSDYTSSSKKLDLLQTLRSHSRTILLGEPGSGKTTSIEKLCLEYAINFYQNSNHSQSVLFPIIIRLSSYTGSLLQSIRSSLNSMGVFQLEEDTFKLNNFLQKLPCLILFDGLNEVNNTQRSTVISNIAQFLNTYPNHKYVITSRPQDELWRMLSPDDIEINLVIQPIDYEDTIRYLSLHLGDKVGRIAYGEVSDKFKDLLRLPLILWMFKEEVYSAQIRLENQGVLINEVSFKASRITPQNRGELYQQFMFKFLLREKQKTGGQIPMREWVKNHVLSDLALSMQKQKTLYFPYQDVIHSLIESINNIHDNTSPILLLDELQKSGILIGESGLGFAHQTFQEFFAASALARLSTETIKDYAADIWWNETIIFLSGITGMESLNKFNDFLQTIADIDPLLAVRCIIEGRSSIIGNNIVQKKLEPMLKSKNWIERKKASEALGIIGDNSVVPKLSALLDDPSGEVRHQTATSLINVSGSEAEVALIKALKDVGWATRARAAEALGQMKSILAIPHLRPLLISDMPRERSDATYSLVLMKVNAETPGISELLSDADNRVSTSVALAIEVCDSPSPIDVLSFQAKNDNPYIREKTVYLLTRFNSVDSIPLIRSLLEDLNSDVVIIAMQSLAELNAVEYLSDIFNIFTHSVPFVREIAAHCCQIFGSKSAVFSLLPLLHDPEPGVRFATVRTLGTLGVSSIISEILPLLQDPSEKVKVQAIIALGLLGDVNMDIIHHLETALEDTSFEVRDAATASIASIKKRQRFKGFFQG